MAIFYVFTVNDPNKVGHFPPSVLASTWYDNLLAYVRDHNLAGGANAHGILFADETALNNYLTTYKCTDAGLLADISAWKSAHNVSYSSQYFALTDASVSVTPIIS